MAAEVFEVDVMGLITVSLIDKSRFKFTFKSTTTSLELVKMVCEKVGVRQAQYFGLKRLRNLRTELDEETAQKVWVAEKAPLFSQGCDSSTTLFLRHKYWFYDIEELHDANTLQLIFEETDRKIMSGQYEVNEDTNLQLAAFRIQIANGDHEPGKQFITEESIRYLLPAYIHGAHTVDEWSRLVEVFHQKLHGQTKQDAQRLYLQLAKENTRHLAVQFFPAQFTTREMKTKVNMLLGVTPEGVGFYTDKKERGVNLQVFLRFRDLSSWQLNPLWNGNEAPDYERPRTTELEQDLEDNPVGPFRTALFMKTKSKRTKDVELEISSFVQEDDNPFMFMNTYHQRFEQYVQLLTLDADKETIVTLRTLDGVSKKLRITSETTGEELISSFAEKIGLQDTSFFQLSVVTDGADRWLSLKEPVALQGVSETTNLYLKLRFFFKNPQELNDAVAKNLYFLQVKESIIAGDIPVSEEDAISLASYHLQTVVGDFDKKKEKAGFFHNNLKDYIPFYLIEFHGRSWWEKKIFSARDRLKGTSKDDVINKYLKIVCTLPNYGLTYFQGILPKGAEDCMIGVGKLGIALFKMENMELIASYRFGYELRSWSNEAEAIELTVKASRNAEEKIISIVSLQFAEVIDLLSYYDKMRKFQKKLAGGNPDTP